MEEGNQDLIAAAKRFLENYYRTFDANRADLANLYRDESVMIFDGRKLQGKEAILAELTSLQQCRHQLHTVHCQPTVVGSGDLLATITGYMWPDGKQDARPFSQMFILIPTPEGSFYASHGTFQYFGFELCGTTTA
ncbi:hypothetical protein NL676_019855 [Syzygium grande]|nr:hypothetical protein NL676_019855 [Syzygium grande]